LVTPFQRPGRGRRAGRLIASWEVVTPREIWSFVVTPAGIVLAAAVALATVVASGENSPEVRPAVMFGEDLIRIFQEGKDAAEQADPPELSLGTAFDPQPPPPQPTDYR
jgi:hypothetical protein